MAKHIQVKEGENGEKETMFPVQYVEESLTVQSQPSFLLGSKEGRSDNLQIRLLS